MIEPTHSEEYLLRSVKKFFVDTFMDGDILDVPIFFDLVERAPTINGIEVDEWMCVLHKSTDVGTFSQGFFQIALLVKNDTDFLKMAAFRDEVISQLQDFEQTDGRLRLAIYNSNWDAEYYAILALGDELSTNILESGIKFKIIPFTLFWGTK